MIRGISIAASGMQAAQTQSEIIGDNIANMQTPGYKEKQAIKEPFANMLLDRLDSLIPYLSSPIGKRGDGVKVTQVFQNNNIGLLDETNKSNDIALISEGFFVVNTPNGERYTRNGHFQIDNLGTLTTQEGYPVQGLNGEVTGLDENFKVSNDGTVYNQNNQIIDKIKIVEAPLDSFSREGQSLYSSVQTPRNVANPQLKQGVLEKSNVDLSGQMEKMIVVMRAYEANQKVIQTQDSTLEKAVNEVGKI